MYGAVPSLMRVRDPIMIELATKRLRLKTPQSRDKWALVEHLNDFEVTKWLSNVPYPYSITDAENWIRTVNASVNSDSSSWQLSVFLRDALIGGVGLRHIEGKSYELGYWLSRANWGKGMATEAATALIRYGRDKSQATRIVAHCMTDNRASQHVLRKLGFEVIGEVDVYSAARDQTLPSLKLSLE